MLCDDFICRSILYPKAWPEGVFDIEALLPFTTEDDKSYVLSVASRYLLETVQGAHEYGCRTAVAGNKRFEEHNKREPAPVREAVHYLGFYDLRCGAVQEIRLNHYGVSIKWRYENGENAHFQIELDPKGSASTKRERKRDRTAARGLVALCMNGPIRYVCDRDQVFRAQLEAIELPDRREDPAALLAELSGTAVGAVVG